MAYNKLQQFHANIKAIELAFQLRKEGRLATEDEKRVLKSYGGFGGLKFILFDPERESQFSQSEKHFIQPLRDFHDILKSNSKNEEEYKTFIRSLRESVLTSFYTPNELVTSIYSVLKETGIEINNLLEPAAGVGNFIEAFDNNNINNIRGYEKDNLTGLILKNIYPKHKIFIDGFETIPLLEKDKYDLIISNVPFGSFAVFDSDFLDQGNKAKLFSTKTIHNYFFVKSLDIAREGGIIAFITSAGVMDSVFNESTRRYLVDNANLLSAIRLPYNTFDNAGTKVMSDLIVLQKQSNKSKLSEAEKKFVKSYRKDGISYSDYYQDMKHVVHTKGYIDKNAYGEQATIYEHEGGIEGIAQDLYKILKNDFEFNFNSSLYSSFIIPREALKPVQQGLFSEVEKVSPVTRENKIRNSKKEKANIGQLDFFSALFEDPAQITTEDVIQIVQGKDSLSEYILDNINYGIYREGTLVFQNDKAGILSNIKDLDEVIITFNDILPDKALKYVQLRDTAIALDRFERENKLENKGLRNQLNRQYDDFYKNFGLVHDNPDLKIDSLIHHTLSLEIKSENRYKKADIFNKVVSFKIVENVTPIEGLAYSLNETGKVDLDLISRVSNTHKSELPILLKDKIILNPFSNEYEIREKFLSGNVVSKIKLLENKLDENPNLTYLSNIINELERVRPQKIPFEEIGFNLGERWIDASLYSKFASHLFDVDTTVFYFKSADEFVINTSNSKHPNITKVYAVNSVNRNYTGLHVLKFALMDTFPKMTKKIVNDKGEETTVPDQEGIIALRSKIQDIRNKFQDWLFSLDTSIKKYIENKYNDQFNCYVKPHYDGSHLTFNDLNMEGLKAIGIDEIYPSQKNAVWMILQNDGGIVDHEVGGGKTLIMILAAHEMKRLGLKNKPLIMAKSANVKAVVDTYRIAYPQDNLIAPSEYDTTPSKRAELFNSIMNQDCVTILSHEQQKMIQQDPDIMISIIQEELDAVIDCTNVVKSTNDLTKKEEKGLLTRLLNKEAKLKNQIYEINKSRDSTLTFKQMGFDHLLCDESQEFKNLTFATRHYMIAGLGNPTGSQRALNMLFSIRTIQESTGKDLGATFLSGTTISNSLTELYLLFKYLRPRALEEQGIKSFDSWAAIFAQKSVDFEFSVTNQLIQKERFRYFIKVPELSNFYAEITDFKTAKDIGVDRPKCDEILVNIPPTKLQEEGFKNLIKFAQTGKGHFIGKLEDVEKKSRMLIATNAARKMALDMRLINPNCDEDKGTKIDVAAKMIAEEYRLYNHTKGTQFVFCDLGTYKPDQWNIYSELKRKLVDEHNLPENEIVFIHESKNRNQKQEIIKKFNAGIIRVLIGSTGKMGVGTNGQERVTSAYDLDPTWKPSDWEQRRGRYERAGNWVAKLFANNRVKRYVIAVERSLDNFQFNLCHFKIQFIKQIKSANITTRRIDEGSADESTGMKMSEYVAILSGNTTLLEKSKLENKIILLEGERTAFLRDKSRSKSSLEKITQDLKEAERTLERLNTDKEHLENTLVKDKDRNTIHRFFFDNKEIKDIKSVVTILKEKAESLRGLEDLYHTIGQYYDLDIVCRVEKSAITSIKYSPLFAVKGKTGVLYRYNNGYLADDPIRAANFFPNALDKIPGLIQTYQDKVIKLSAESKTLMSFVNSTWRKEEELNELKLKLADLDLKISKDMNNSKGNNLEMTV